jgi:dihydrofolate reductase
MKTKNSVFIAASLDGYIADKQGGIDWLHAIPNPEGNDMGYNDFISRIDAIIMGRTTFETVCSFDVEWPYEKPVFVLSNTMTDVPEKYVGKAKVVKGKLTDTVNSLQKQNFNRLYIDGGRTIQSFLQEDLIDELIVTTIPVLLGGGSKLFSDLPKPLHFECVASKRYLDKVVQNCFARVK